MPLKFFPWDYCGMDFMTPFDIESFWLCSLTLLLTNYAKQAINLLFQYQYLFSEHWKAQLLWFQTVNTRACRIQMVIRHMGAQNSASMIQRAGKSIEIFHHVYQIFVNLNTC